MKRLFLLTLVLCAMICALPGQTRPMWRTATPEELESILPARAPVDKERIESEMRTASGIINDKGQMIASVLLITAGYAADGKYSHYLLLQSPMKLDNLQLGPGAYVLGWSRTAVGLEIHVFEAANVKERGVVLAKLMPQPRRVESFRIWAPEEQRLIQIGRYGLPYSLGN